MIQETMASKIWRMFYPLLLCLGIQAVISTIAGLVITAKIIVQLNPATYEDILTASMDAAVRYAVLIAGIAAVFIIPLACLFMRRDIKLGKISIQKRTAPAAAWPVLIITGILTCIGGNIIVTLFSLQYIFSDYAQVSEQLYSGNFIIQLIFIGIIVPISEELIFRGLIYNRAKSYMGSTLSAMLVSALIFSIYHGNMVQGIYAFVIGFMMAFLYEKYGSLAAPVLFHICCNLPAVIMQKIQLTIGSLYTAAYIAVGCTAAVAVLLLIIHRIIPDSAFKKYADAGGSYSGRCQNPHGSGQESSPYNRHDFFHGSPFNPSDKDGNHNDNTDGQKTDKSAPPKQKYSVDDYYPKPKDDSDIPK